VLVEKPLKPGFHKTELCGPGNSSSSSSSILYQYDEMRQTWSSESDRRLDRLINEPTPDTAGLAVDTGLSQA